MMPRDLRLSVLTNAVPVAARLARLRVDVAFIGTDGLTVEHGLSTPDHAEAAAKRAIIASSRRVVVLMDSSKLGQEHTVRFAEPRDVDVLVTDGGTDRRTVDALERQGVQVVVA